MPDTPTFSRAACAAPHHLAAEAGRRSWRRAANALEAMVAMAATIAVVYPHMNGIGGDGFWLVREPGGRVRAIEACGPAGALATIRRYRDREYDATPSRGPDAAVTVAGRSAAGRRRWRSPAGACRCGCWSRRRYASPARAWRCRRPRRAMCRRNSTRFTTSRASARPPPHDGAAPKAGAIRRLPALAATLDQLGHAGLDDFYRGDVSGARSRPTWSASAAR